MQKQDYIDYFSNQLAELYTKRDLEIIVGDFMIYKVFERLSKESILDQLRDFVPHQYISGRCYFYDFDLSVDENTLIPRPETEELVYLIVQNHASEKPRILDIGTGSGCIAIALAKHIGNAKVTAMDVSSKALEVVAKNAEEHKLEIEIVEKNILSTESLEQKYDVIVSNPPYIPNSEKVLMHKNVLEHEPHLALFVDNTEPIIFYEKIAELALDALNPGGTLYYECNEYNAKDVKKMLEDLGFKSVEIHSDMQGKDRMISCSID